MKQSSREVPPLNDLLIRHFIRDADNTHDPQVRSRYGYFGSVVGALSNVLLFLVKFLMGSLANSVSITADAFNNLSDAGSSLVTLLGFRMAAKPPDRDHPYGHGRAEYLSGLFIAALIFMVGLEFVKTSVEKILRPDPVVFHSLVVVGLLLSIGVKLWLGRLSARLGRAIQSSTLAATAADSLTDVAATSVTLLSVLLSPFTTFPVDGVMGLVVAGFILWAGYGVARDTITPLLGQAPDPALLEEIRSRLLCREGILGIHDLIVHDYGPGRVFVSVHAEVPAAEPILLSHEIIDTAEREIGEALGLEIVIHLDPVDTESESTNRLRCQMTQAVESIDPAFSIHDFRVVMGEKRTNLIFDILVPIGCKLGEEELKALVEQKAKEIAPHHCTVVNIDRDYT